MLFITASGRKFATVSLSADWRDLRLAVAGFAFFTLAVLIETLKDSWSDVTRSMGERQDESVSVVDVSRPYHVDCHLLFVSIVDGKITSTAWCLLLETLLVVFTFLNVYPVPVRWRRGL